MEYLPTEKLSFIARLIQILLLGVLSMFFAEVYSGSSQIWFTTTWALTDFFQEEASANAPSCFRYIEKVEKDEKNRR